VVCGVLVIVAVAVPEGVTLAGLMVHTGVELVGWLELTWHAKATDPLKPDPEAGSTRIEIDEVPPGAMATGFRDPMVRVNSLVPVWAGAAGTKIESINRPKAVAPPSLVQKFFLDRDASNFTMSRF
jgi:hypothetical protein